MKAVMVTLPRTMDVTIRRRKRKLMERRKEIWEAIQSLYGEITNKKKLSYVNTF